MSKQFAFLLVMQCLKTVSEQFAEDLQSVPYDTASRAEEVARVAEEVARLAEEMFFDADDENHESEDISHKNNKKKLKLCQKE